MTSDEALVAVGDGAASVPTAMRAKATLRNMSRELAIGNAENLCGQTLVRERAPKLNGICVVETLGCP
jgi:hypothetical protein